MPPPLDATAFNNTIGIVKGVCKLAIELGARLDNPAESLKRLPVKTTESTLPSIEQLHKFVESVGNGVGNRNRFSKLCANLVQFLAFGGFRKTEAANVTWQDVELEKGFITVRGHEFTGTKNSEVRRVPILADMHKLLTRLQAERPDRKPTEKVMEARECEKAMIRASEQIGIPRITQHDLRHFFATRCIESRVPIQAVSCWLGPKDGGALAMKICGHLRDEHSAEMAKRVSFSRS